MTTGLVYHKRYLDHGTGNHPENPGRLQAIVSHLQVSGLLDKLELLEAVEIEEDFLLQVHTPEMVERVKAVCDSGGGNLDLDTVASSESYRVALLAAGGLVEAIEAVMRGEVSYAMALVRPPGHHAMRARSMGFCLFNNVAIGARHLVNVHGLDKILCIDWDLHHGNGTQDIFYGSPEVFYMSLHMGNYYPGTGLVDEKGDGDGVGFTLNCPLPAGTSEEEYLERFGETLETATDRFSPEFVLVSAGFDAHRDDPLGGLLLTERGYAELTRSVKRVAEEHCSGRLVSVLEGGYHPDALARSVHAHLEVLIGK
jgi:acetoin utilization deacetylase AcuC-like enzyme